jgi:hypothetical protein
VASGGDMAYSSEQGARRALGVGAHQRLKRGLERLDAAERFDLTLIDCPPGTTR